MFSQTFVEVGDSSCKPCSVVASFTLQVMGLAVLVAVPLLFTDSLPRRDLTSIFTIPPPPAPAPAPRRSTVTPTRSAPRPFDPSRIVAPTHVPKEITPIVDAPVLTPGVSGATGVPGGTNSPSVLRDILDPLSKSAPPPPTQKVTEAPKVTRLKVGGTVQAANLIRQVKPVYPQLARQARISGAVRFTAVISRDGTIQNLQLISGHPLLVAAAQEAVKQWLYKPTLLNGEPVEVVTQIDVNFVLGQ